MNLLCLFLFCFGLLNSQVFSAPGLSSPESDANNDDFADHQDTVVCGELSDTCAGCLTTRVSFYLFSLIFQLFSKKLVKILLTGIVSRQELRDTYGGCLTT